MNTLIRLKRTTPVVVIASVLTCFALSSATQAVIPPPDGGYPGFTTAEGSNALQNLTTGVGNTAAGWHSLFTNSVGNMNTAIGAGTLLFNTGNNNTATGALALLSNTIGIENTANGAFALVSSTSSGNTAIGAYALNHNTTGALNTAIGDAALLNNTTGEVNVALGELAGVNNTIGDGNTIVGARALINNITGGNNIALGLNAGENVTSAGSTICIGSAGANVNNSCYIGNIFDATSSGGTAVYCNSNGRLGTVQSSRRFKEKIKPMENASEVLFALKPVTFRYKQEVDPEGTVCRSSAW